MRIEPYLEHIPEIERRLRLLEPDAIIIGCGPSAHLIPWMDQALLESPRRFGVHDVFKIAPVDDLIIMDPPINLLHDGTARFKTIIESRPKRWWVYPKAWSFEEREKQMGIPFWSKQLPPCVKKAVRVQDWHAWLPGQLPSKKEGNRMVPDKWGFNLEADPPETTCMSPAGATTLAWMLGCRRIGVIGMDANMVHHPSSAHASMVNMFMRCIAKQASERGGAIWNLSPISTITKFNPPDCESSSEQTSGNETPEPKPSSVIAS